RNLCAGQYFDLPSSILIIKKPGLARHEPHETARASVQPPPVGLAFRSEASTLGRNLGQTEFEMSLPVSKGCVAIVGRIDESAANGLAGYSADHGTVNNIRLIVRLQVLPENLLGA